MKNIVYFDLETRKLSNEVGGWGNVRKMRMSLAVTYSTLRGGYLVYSERRVPDLVDELRRADLVVGFNVIRFDYVVLEGENPFFDPGQLRTLDLLAELQRTLSQPVSLDAVASATLGVEKTGDGLQAVRLYREGKLIELAEYCCYDVKITRLVHEHGLEHRRVFVNRAGQRVAVPVCW
jgi:DEAD/DEAH box helicase domain-containing protein